MDIIGRLEQLTAAPRNWSVLVAYADGRVKRHDVRSRGQAENFAVGERRKIGRDLIDRMSGAKVRVLSVNIVPIADAP